MESADHRPDWLRGVLDLCLLALLDDGEAYGYELARRLETLGFGPVAGGSLYPALLRREKLGHLRAALARGRGWSRTQVLRAHRRRTWRVGARARGVARLRRERRAGARRGAGAMRPETWLDELAHELSARGVAGTTSPAIVVEAEAHLRETGAAPLDAFGSPAAYAALVADALEPRSRAHAGAVARARPRRALALRRASGPRRRRPRAARRRGRPADGRQRRRQVDAAAHPRRAAAPDRGDGSSSTGASATRPRTAG